MKKISVILILTLAISFTNAQDVVLEQDVLGDTIPSEKGQNLKHFSHFYIGGFFPASETEGNGANINYGKSYGIEFGYRYKRKLLSFYSVGYDVNYNLISYNIVQEAGKVFPNTNLHHKELLLINNLEANLYNRISFGKRGNFIKYFIDFGAYGDFAFSNYHLTIDKFDIPNEDNAKRTETKNSKLTYLNIYSYGAKVRIGYNRYILTANYRLSDMFKSDFEGTFVYYPELPRLTVGLQIGFY